MLAGCDALAGRRRALSVYVGHTLRHLHVMLVLSLLAALVVGAGTIIVGVFGLWAAAVHCVLLPALLWDGAGWGAMGRTQALTREYRWPIAGLLLLVAAGCIVVLVTLALAAERLTHGRAFLPLAFSILSQVIVVPLLAAVPAVIHARLRTIKEGVGGEDLHAVFG